jgi:hypothetical protein
VDYKPTGRRDEGKHVVRKNLQIYEKICRNICTKNKHQFTVTPEDNTPASKHAVNNINDVSVRI